MIPTLKAELTNDPLGRNYAAMTDQRCLHNGPNGCSNSDYQSVSCRI